MSYQPADNAPDQKILDQVRQFRAMSDEEKKAFMGNLPEFAAPLVKVAEDMSDSELGHVIKGAQGLQEGKFDTHSLGALHRAYKRIPAEGRREITSNLPPQVRAFVPAVEKLPTESVVELAQGVIELKSNPSSADPETIGKAISHLKELPAETKSALKQELVEAKVMEEAQFDVMEEVLEGMTGEEAVECIKLVQQESKAKSSSPPEDLEGEGGLIDGETKKQITMFAQMAKMLIKIQTRRLTAWVKECPTSVRVLNFLGGLAMFALLLVWTIWLSLFRGYFFQFVLQLWLLAFSMVVMILNAHVPSLQRYVVPTIEFWCPMLSTTYGRGWFLVVTGLLGLSSCNDDSLTLYPMLVVALGAVLTGGIGVVAGWRTQSKLNAMLARIDSLERLENLFASADADRNGFLDKKELATITMEMGVDLSEEEVYLLLDSIDHDNDGKISFEEIKAWWSTPSVPNVVVPLPSEGDVADAMTPLLDKKTYERLYENKDKTLEMLQAMDVVKTPPSVLAVANILVALWNIGGAVYGITVEIVSTTIELRTERFIFVYVNAIMAVLALVIFTVEVASWSSCLHSANAYIRARFKFLSTVLGRGIFLFFCAAVGLAHWAWWRSWLETGVASVALFACAVLNIAYGKVALEKFKKLKAGLKGDAFAKADLDHSGTLNRAELVALCERLGVPLNRREFELMVRTLDADGDGEVSTEEFERWYSAQLY